MDVNNIGIAHRAAGVTSTAFARPWIMKSNSRRDGLATDEENSSFSDALVGERLASLRLRAGLTQTDVARELHISRQHVSNIETGFTSPTLNVLNSYLAACGSDLPSFFYGPLPKRQSARQRDYHRKLQDLLESPALATTIMKVLDSFHTSLEGAAAAAVQPPRVQAKRSRSGRT
jgi:transcriptional regulator with XRE-family HTH domain